LKTYPLQDRLHSEDLEETKQKLDKVVFEEGKLEMIMVRDEGSKYSRSNEA
jgi:hypothetical protein